MMCTTITVDSKEGLVAGRTMEFALDLDFKVAFVPRNIVYQKDESKNDLVSKKAFVGGISPLNGDLIFFDGINEDGLIACANYFGGFADYPDEPTGTKKVVLRTDILVQYVLTNCKNVDEIKEIVKDIELLDTSEAKALPCHYAFYDSQGKKIIIEPLNKTLKVTDNPVGVMTNGPTFDWHLTNLRNYLHIQPTNRNTGTFSDYSFNRIGEGTGLLGLPGDNTPPSRFVRAAYFVNNMPKQETAKDALDKAFHILSHFDIPYGASYNPDVKGYDIVHYTSVMDSHNKTYNMAKKLAGPFIKLI